MHKEQSNYCHHLVKSDYFNSLVIHKTVATKFLRVRRALVMNGTKSVPTQLEDGFTGTHSALKKYKCCDFFNCKETIGQIFWNEG